MDKLWRIFGRAAGVLMLLLGLLFVVYFWSLDKKLFAFARRTLRHLIVSGSDTSDPKAEGIL